MSCFTAHVSGLRGTVRTAAGHTPKLLSCTHSAASNNEVGAFCAHTHTHTHYLDHSRGFTPAFQICLFGTS